jgi:hypothetical protein
MLPAICGALFDQHDVIDGPLLSVFEKTLATAQHVFMSLTYPASWPTFWADLLSGSEHRSAVFLEFFATMLPRSRRDDIFPRMEKDGSASAVIAFAAAGLEAGSAWALTTMSGLMQLMHLVDVASVPEGLRGSICQALTDPGTLPEALRLLGGICRNKRTERSVKRALVRDVDAVGLIQAGVTSGLAADLDVATVSRDIAAVAKVAGAEALELALWLVSVSPDQAWNVRPAIWEAVNADEAVTPVVVRVVLGVLARVLAEADDVADDEVSCVESLLVALCRACWTRSRDAVWQILSETLTGEDAVARLLILSKFDVSAEQVDHLLGAFGPFVRNPPWSREDQRVCLGLLKVLGHCRGFSIGYVPAALALIAAFIADLQEGGGASDVSWVLGRVVDRVATLAPDTVRLDPTLIFGFAGSCDDGRISLAAHVLQLVGEDEREEITRQALTIVASDLSAVPGSAGHLLAFLGELSAPPACCMEFLTGVAPLIIADDLCACRLIGISERLLGDAAAPLWMAMLDAGIGPQSLRVVLHLASPLVGSEAVPVMPIVNAVNVMNISDFHAENQQLFFRGLSRFALAAMKNADEATILELIAMAARFGSNRMAAQPLLVFLLSLPRTYDSALLAAGYGSMWQALLEDADLALQTDKQGVVDAIRLALRLGLWVEGLPPDAQRPAIVEFVTNLRHRTA